jgi:hypothetical protein
MFNLTSFVKKYLKNKLLKIKLRNPNPNTKKRASQYEIGIGIIRAEGGI